MKVLLLRPNNNPKVIEDFNPEDLAKVLECRWYTCVERKIGDQLYDLWVDDEGLLKTGIDCTGLCTDFEEILAGNMVIANRDNQDMASLTNYDIVNICKNLFQLKQDKLVLYNAIGLGQVKCKFSKDTVCLKYSVR